MRVLIPLFPGVTTLDAVGPYEVLRQLPGVEVHFPALTPGVVTDGANNLGLRADSAFAEFDSADVLVVPGGPGARPLQSDDVLLAWIARMHAGSRWTTSVCTGSLILGAAGLLRGLDATTHWSAVADLEAHGARYTEERVVVRDRVITAAGVSAGIDMALTLAERLAGPVPARAAQLSVEYDPQPPFDSGAPSKATPEVMAYVTERRRR
ncbi:DJ-1/PfpI family protein [Streptomyces triticirhizae]|uniref:DJ-1/PfpI family protein n=1 Tax=Streptomyces triticirhizae TaxID=2483353 RepID=A0A3M2M9A2_9ACTN|nr:DJ-1/PfpI family protein [Streptomyces triticirhizae]RMI46059.1 DJ-1/PfpI family protein [Streptomyces triticirhizae]